MCFGGGGQATRQQPKREFQNRPVTVTGSQEGVDDPKDTAKATESLRIQRKKEEGTYVDPTAASLTTAAKLTRSGGRGGAKERNERAARLKRGYSKGNPTKAQSLAKARMGNKSITGRQKSKNRRTA